MPCTVASLFAGAKVERHGVVAWGERIPQQKSGPRTGVYIVAVTDDPDRIDVAVGTCPLSATALEELLKIRHKELKVDDRPPDAAELAARLAGFWCPDEVVLYVGRAGPRQNISVSELSDRVAEYYKTPLGARSPHAGGWPLKTLANLAELHVHYGYCSDYKTAQTRMLDHFAEQLSDDTLETLYDSTFVMPFGNLEDGHGRRKRHGIKGARAPKNASRSQPAARSAPTPSARPAAARPDGDATEATVSAPELARRLGVSPKTLRAWLRGQAGIGHPLLASHEHQGRWYFTEVEAHQLANEYRRQQ